MLDFRVDSVRGFIRLWVVISVLVLAYAYFDLRLTPALTTETHFSMQPDWSRLPDLMHWGGRLLMHGALGLLLGNAIVLGGFVALLIRGATRIVQRTRSAPEPERVSVTPAPPPTSVRPQSSQYSSNV